jgi:hypothetical protein
VIARSFLGRVLLEQGHIERGLAVLDACMLAVSGSEVSPHTMGLVDCIAMTSCHREYGLERAREWTSVLSSWCESQPQLVTFATSCLVHRAELLQLSGAWGEAVEEARRTAEGGVAVGEPAFYVVGMHFQYALSSTMIDGVGRVAAHILSGQTSILR